MPLPMVPAPTMPTVWIAIIFVSSQISAIEPENVIRVLTGLALSRASQALKESNG